MEGELFRGNQPFAWQRISQNLNDFELNITRVLHTDTSTKFIAVFKWMPSADTSYLHSSILLLAQHWCGTVYVCMWVKPQLRYQTELSWFSIDGSLKCIQSKESNEEKIAMEKKLEIQKWHSRDLPSNCHSFSLVWFGLVSQRNCQWISKMSLKN